MPFRDLDPNMLPKKLREKLRNDWIPIFKKMEAAPNTPNFSTIDTTRSLNEETIESSYTITTDHLRTEMTVLPEKGRFNNNRKRKERG